MHLGLRVLLVEDDDTVAGIYQISESPVRI
jgi:hypothetical protein